MCLSLTGSPSDRKDEAFDVYHEAIVESGRTTLEEDWSKAGICRPILFRNTTTGDHNRLAYRANNLVVEANMYALKTLKFPSSWFTVSLLLPAVILFLDHHFFEILVIICFTLFSISNTSRNTHV